MTFSVITIGSGLKSHGLYCSEIKSIIMVGLQDELFAIKHLLEEMEQQLSNRKHFDELKNEYLNIMTSGGNSLEESENLLKQKMPHLYDHENQFQNA